MSHDPGMDVTLDLSQVALSSDKHGVILPILVKPRGRANAITGMRERALLVSVAAAPVDGAANAAVIAVLSTALGLPKSRMEIARGHKSREKAVRVSGLAIEDMRTRLAAL